MASKFANLSELILNTIEDYINHWDLMVKQFFISKHRLEGYEP